MTEPDPSTVRAGPGTAPGKSNGTRVYDSPITWRTTLEMRGNGVIQRTWIAPRSRRSHATLPSNTRAAKR